MMLVPSKILKLRAMDDDAMHDILGIDGVDQFLIYCATVGKTDLGKP